MVQSFNNVDRHSAYWRNIHIKLRIQDRTDREKPYLFVPGIPQNGTPIQVLLEVSNSY
jgi:hypothetical protein